MHSFSLWWVGKENDSGRFHTQPVVCSAQLDAAPKHLLTDSQKRTEAAEEAVEFQEQAPTGGWDDGHTALTPAG